MRRMVTRRRAYSLYQGRQHRPDCADQPFRAHRTVAAGSRPELSCVDTLFMGPLLAAIAIGLFAGLRTSELAALDWQDVHLTGSQRFIEVTARKAKTRQRRAKSATGHGWERLKQHIPNSPPVPGDELP
jgi:integrase